MDFLHKKKYKTKKDISFFPLRSCELVTHICISRKRVQLRLFLILTILTVTTAGSIPGFGAVARDGTSVEKTKVVRLTQC